jgi:tryptophanyl-tRNA synthetase
VEKVLNEFGGKNFSELKIKLADSLIDSICPIGKKIKEYLNDSKYLEKVLIDGSHKASEIATKNLEEIYDIIGLKKFT